MLQVEATAEAVVEEATAEAVVGEAMAEAAAEAATAEAVEVCKQNRSLTSLKYLNNIVDVC